MSGRRQRYVPVDVLVAFSPFGTRLYERWGMEGLAAWMLLLAAAKREPAQGTFTYTSEVEAWTKLGATATGFTFAEFITACGRAKQTRKTRSGRVVYVEITGWGRWNDEWSREKDSAQKSRKRAHSTPDKAQTIPGQFPAHPPTESDTESDNDLEAEPSSADFKIPDPHARLLAALTDKSPLTVERIASMHRKHRFAEADFEEAREAAADSSCLSPSAVAISVLKKRVKARAA